MADLTTFEQYYQLSGTLMEQATKEQLAERARLLALNVAHYQVRHGGNMTDDFAIAAVLCDLSHVNLVLS